MVPSHSEWGKPVKPTGYCRNNDMGLLRLGHKRCCSHVLLSGVTCSGGSQGPCREDTKVVLWSRPHAEEPRPPATADTGLPATRATADGPPAQSSPPPPAAQAGSWTATSRKISSGTVRPSCSPIPGLWKMRDDACYGVLGH